MPSASVLDRLLTGGVVAVVRGDDGSKLVDVAEALVDGGVTGIEVTFTVPRAHRVLEEVADALGDAVELGAGTVLDAETARIAILSGAEFVVSPAVSLGVIETAKRYGKAVFPGALTPTEVLAAWQAGADAVKIFPSDLTGPGYLKALAGPFPQIRMMPTGGVNLETAEAFLAAGACALGVGSALVDAKTVASGDFKVLTDRARKYRAIVDEYRKKLGSAAISER
jgi:2-dehydro-3-deoxyphosphogluconate aldolase/(4S)-4-hydroxy-2-oxoglutarate aldolase